MRKLVQEEARDKRMSRNQINYIISKNSGSIPNAKPK